MHAHMHMQAVTITTTTSEPVLLVGVHVVCDVCGDYDLVVAGHHLRPLVELLQTAIDHADPALVESGDQEKTVVHRSTHPSSN